MDGEIVVPYPDSPPVKGLGFGKALTNKQTRHTKVSILTLLPVDRNEATM